MPGPLSPAEAAEALRAAALVARGDRGHDLMTVLDVLARDHHPEYRSPWVLEQLADAVVDYVGGDRSRPITSALKWCRTHDASLPELLNMVAESVEPAAAPATVPGTRP